MRLTAIISLWPGVIAAKSGGVRNGSIRQALISPPAESTPMIVGVAPSIDRPNIVLAQDVDYPPYAILGDASTGFSLSGFGHDVALGLTEVCDIDITVTQTDWSECWGDGKIGPGLASGLFHGCSTYTHSSGVRNRYVEFSAPILGDNRPAGLITRLSADGKPVIDGLSNLAGKKVANVIGWAPTPDTIPLVKNSCTGETFDDYTVVESDINSGNANDDALRYLLDGKADALWIYADQAEKLKCGDGAQTTEWNCTLWDGFGKDFAYVHTGMFDWTIAGTTLSLSKKGSNLPAILNPCIEAFKQTESYYELCEKYDLLQTCFRNDFFPEQQGGNGTDTSPPFTSARDLDTSCSEGYCSCAVN